MPETAEAAVGQIAEAELAAGLIVAFRIARGRITDRKIRDWLGTANAALPASEMTITLERIGRSFGRRIRRIGNNVGRSTVPPINNIGGHDQRFRYTPDTNRLLVILRRTEFELVRGFDQNQRDELRRQFRQALAEYSRVPGLPDQPLPTGSEVSRRVYARIRDAMTLDPRSVRAATNFETRLRPGDGNQPPSAAYRRYRLRDRSFDSVIDEAIAQGRPLTDRETRMAAGGYRNNLTDARARRVARTESVNIVNVARLEAWRQAVAEGRFTARSVRRFWTTQGDEKVRGSHMRIPGLNPSGRGLNSLFRTPLGPLLYPADRQRGSPANTIQCRCYIRTRVTGRMERRQSEARRTVEQVNAYRRVGNRR